MWTQMVLNFHIFNFYTTRFSHITHATPKMPFPHQIWNFIHLQFNEQFEVSRGCTTCQPIALLWQGHIFSVQRFFCIFYCILPLLFTKKTKEKLPSVIFSIYYISWAVVSYDCSCLCFMNIIASQIPPSTQVSISFKFFSAPWVISASSGQSVLLAPSQSWCLVILRCLVIPSCLVTSLWFSVSGNGLPLQLLRLVSPHRSLPYKKGWLWSAYKWMGP